MRRPPGLCDTCRHQQIVRNTRGSEFSLCRRARTDAAYPKYPRLPVLRCPGWEPSPPDDAAAGTDPPGRGGASRPGPDESEPSSGA